MSGLHWVSAGDGTRLALHRISSGRGGPPVLAAHATGFCGTVLGPLARAHLAMTGAGTWWLMDLRGHGYSEPGASGDPWSALAGDVLAASTAVAAHADPASTSGLVGLGHSAGGAALVMAEASRPGTFERLHLYEPVIWPDLAEARERAGRLVEGALRRRHRFDDRDAARHRLATKAPFVGFHPDALAAYLDHGLAESGSGGVELRCHPETEAAYYQSATESATFHLLGRIACPVTVAVGRGPSSLGEDLARAVVDALPDATLERHPDLGHFGPMQDPTALASALASISGSP